jgi:hypothetical protein
MRRRFLWLTCAFVLAAVPLAGCAPAAQQLPSEITGPPTLSGQSTQPTPSVLQYTAVPITDTINILETPMSPPTTPPLDPIMQRLADQARQDLAGRLRVDPTTIEVVSFESVTWPDGSLGCPQPGMAYTQVPMDGYRLVLSVGKREFQYHGGGARRAPFLCEKPANPAPGAGGPQ